MCSSVGPIKVPANNLELVTLGAQPLRNVLGLAEGDLTPLIIRLEKDHAVVSRKCQEALSFKAQKKSWKDFGYKCIKTIPISASITTAGGALFAHALSLNYRTVLAAASLFGVIVGLIFAVEEDKPNSEIGIKSGLERNWMVDKLEELTPLYKVACQKVRDCQDENFDLDENKLNIKTRDQLSMLVDYFTKASQSHHYRY